MKVDKDDIREAFEKLERELVERDADSRLLDYWLARIEHEEEKTEDDLQP